jgi:hypothetical protein
MTIAMREHGGVVLRPGEGCELSDDSRTESLADADRDGRATEFLRLHRVLTEAVQIRATAGDFDYMIELRA